MKKRSIKKISKSRPTIEGAGVHLKRAFGFGNENDFEPFLLLDDFRSSKPENYLSGFPWHPHRGIETITYVLKGKVEHKDSMGNSGTISHGDVQVMSAGSGITHSEYNRNKDKLTKFLQIWVFPNKKDVTPRYDQLTLNVEDRHNKLQQILSPNADDEGVWIHQNAWFHLGNFDKGVSAEYTIKAKTNGVYVFVFKGDVTIDNQQLNTRDGFGVWDTDKIQIQADSDSEFLLMEIPMAM